VSQLYQEANDLSLYTSCYDRVLMVLTFHDLFYVAPAQGWPKIDSPTLMNKINTSVKLGGLVRIIDHISPIGSGEQAVQTLRRIDP
jgi:predicted methyltransferase